MGIVTVRQWLLVALWLCCTVAALAHNSRPHIDVRLRDFESIRLALEKYRVDHRVYPEVKGAAVGLGRGWIPGLVPNYLSEVPRDPLRSRLANKQYIYMSNGQDYKLIAHGVENVPFVSMRYPGLIDPRRKEYAYGIWTSGAAHW